MRIKHEQYKSIIGLGGCDHSASHPVPEEIRQILNLAARVARKGHFQEAEKLIASLPMDGPLGSVTLDLKARICAQQGRLVEAQLCWMEAVRQSPGNESYRRSLNYAELVFRPSRMPVTICFSLIVLCVYLMVLVVRS